MAGAAITPGLRLVRPLEGDESGQLWVAQNLTLQIEVAVEVAPPEDGEGESVSPFESQARVAARLADPHVVQILEHGKTASRMPYLATELLEQKSLRSRLEAGRVTTLAEAQAIVAQTAGTLAKAHALSLSHGRVCPDYLHVTDAGGEPFVKIEGFGVESLPATEDSPQHPYSSPEQVLNERCARPQDDLWALAVTVYELLTTTLPFEASTPTGVTAAICQAEFSPPGRYRADLPPAVDAWFARALLRRAEGRFPDAAAMAQAFARAASGQSEDGHALDDEDLTPPPTSRLPDLARTTVGSDDDEDEQTVQWELPEDWSLPPSAPTSQVPSAASGPPPLPSRGHSPRPPPLAPSSAPGSRPSSSVAPDDGPTQTVPPPFSVPPSSGSIPSAPPGSTPPVASRPALVPSAPAPVGGDRSLDPAALGAHVVASSDHRHYEPGSPARSRRRSAIMALIGAAALVVVWSVLPSADDATGEPPVTSTQAASPGAPARTADEPPAILRTEDLPTIEEDEPEAEPSAAITAAGAAGAPAATSLVSASRPAPPRAAPRRRPKRRAKAAKSGCKPPYYFDENGIRRLKMNCL